MSRVIYSVLFILNFKISTSNSFYDLDLPLSHVQYYFNRFPLEKTKCLNNNSCIYKEYIFDNVNNDYNAKACWGYESNCDIKTRFSKPECKHNTLVEGQNILDVFYHQADFGYVEDQINEIKTLCKPENQNDSSLECTSYLRFCRGNNIYIDFSDISANAKPFRYKIDVLKYGQIGGHCDLKKEDLLNAIDHLGALQSWAPELRFFKKIGSPLSKSGLCDIMIDKPTILMKLDAQSNMYHHFCDFFNLYLSLHVNHTHPDVYAKNVQIILWETYNYYGPFEETFKAFSKNPVWTLKDLSGKKVCFKNLLMPLLPRMIFGLYYNTPIVNNCHKSGVFKAFSEFILHRLKIPFEPVSHSKIRITFIIRKTKYRRVLNEQELLDGLRKQSSFKVKAVSFEAITNFKKQLEIVRNTDILIGMHGAGLTHLLFLPDWASIFELYNCGDPNCYKDLARLRGINYVTWENSSKLFPQDEGSHPDGGAHEKFTNYNFDRNEFLQIVEKAADYIRSHESYIKLINKSKSSQLKNKKLEL